MYLREWEKALLTLALLVLPVREKFSIFVSIEEVVPPVGVVLEDLEVMRSYGKIFGHEDYDMNGRITNFAVGSYGTFLNKTEYDYFSHLQQWPKSQEDIPTSYYHVRISLNHWPFLWTCPQTNFVLLQKG